MNCDSAKQALPLYYYGELEADAEELVEAHCSECAECRKALEGYQQLAKALDSRELVPSEALLSDCRHDLMRAVYRGDRAEQPRPAQSGTWELFGRAFASLFGSAQRWRQPVGAFALLALGYFGARFTTKAPAEAGGEGMIATIRSVQPDASGSVRISFDETHRRLVSGRLDDGNIQKLLLTAARDENNAGVRVESMDLLKTHGTSQEVRRALLDAVAHDPNSGVRLKALEGLGRFASDGEVRRVLAQVLITDETPGMRIRAIDMLTAQKDEAMVGVLQGVVDKESNSYVRSRCEKALKDMNASVGTF